MLKRPEKFLLLLFFATVSLVLNAQKSINTTGTAQVRVEGNMTQDESYELAEQQAKINAIENAFGSYAEQQMDMTIKEGMTSYDFIGTTKVKGDWIKTTSRKFKEDFRKEETKHGLSDIKYISCTIKGKVRKSIPKASIEYKILNHPDILSRTHSFYIEESLYVFFKSPVNGFLSIFLENENAVYRLLPYMDMSDNYQSGVPIKSDTDYLFFSPKDNAFPDNYVDEQYLFSLKADIEYNYVYIVFSEDEYVKPMLEDSTLIDKKIIPKQLSKKRFRQWLIYNRASSEAFQEIGVKISIVQEE